MDGRLLKPSAAAAVVRVENGWDTGVLFQPLQGQRDRVAHLHEGAEQQRQRGEKMWNEAGESEAAYDEALRVISEADAKIASAAEKA
jgi:hypothetical protein